MIGHWLERIPELLAWVAASGWTGILGFLGVDVIFCVLFLPGTVLALGAGAAFGLGKGFLLVSIGDALGASLAFLLGRTLARPWAERKVMADPRFLAVDQAVGREGWKIVALTRLSPFFPFSVLNYVFGLSSIPLKDYVLATWIGMVPSVFVHVYFGTVLGDVSQGREHLNWALDGGLLAFTMGVAYFIARIAKRALLKEVEGS